MKGPLLLLLFLLCVASFASAQASSGRIEQIRAINASTGFVRTSLTIYSTKDAGETWNEVSVPTGTSERLGDFYFADGLHGWVVVVGGGAISLLNTSDGGASWARTSLDLPIPDMSGVDLASSELQVSKREMTLTLRKPTSSNFAGREVYTSLDGGSSWKLAEDVIEAGSDEDMSNRMMSGAWTLVSDGACTGGKTGCFEEQSLLAGGRNITPPQVREQQAVEKLNARQEGSLQTLAPGGSTRISLSRGFDKCTAGSVAQMQAWWDNSPFFDSNIYISGRNRGCSQPLLNAAWVDAVSKMGWGLIPTVVGYQSPCISSSTFTRPRFSIDPATAEQQGREEAGIAATDATALGLTPGTILYYDLERYDETTATTGCRTASTAFLKGWTERVKELGYRSGTYGSPRNAMDDWQFMPLASRMEVVWLANWDNNPTVWSFASFPTFPKTQWVDHQRIKQWVGPRNETWGGVTFNIDNNVADGPVAGLAIRRNRRADFDGDGKSDLSVFRTDSGTWHVANSANSTVSDRVLGTSTDLIVPGDYDGDGKTDIAIFKPDTAVWSMIGKGDSATAKQWGQSGDMPVPGDYNGDGKTDLAVFRSSAGVWSIFNSDSLATTSTIQLGAAGDKPVVGDYDGDGRADAAVFRPSNATWYVSRSSTGAVTEVRFGYGTDLPVQADYDGDGKTDLAVFSPSTGKWKVWRTSKKRILTVELGVSGDVAVPADYDGDGADDIAIFRPSTAMWYVQRSTAGATALEFGSSTDLTIPNAYLAK